MNANQWELANAVEAKGAPFVPSAMKKLIVAVGLSAHSEATARYAAKWAERFGASINLVHVCPLESGDGFGISQEVITALRLQRESAQEALSVLAKDIQESCPDCQMTVLEGDPVGKVTSLARSLNADLIVIGSRHQTGFLGRLFAPNTERNIIHGAPCPVLVYQENCCKSEVSSADDSWRKPLPARKIYLPHLK
jgi:nucleotide-binding universal stress UspA family protein